MRQKNNGFTLIEALVVVALIGILAAVAVPAFTRMTERNHLKAAAETLFNDLQLARTEAIKRNQDVDLTFSAVGPATTWAYGLRTGATCDPALAVTAANACKLAANDVLKVTRSADFPGVSLQVTFAAAAAPVALPRAEFEPRQGLADVAGGAYLVLGADQLRVVVSTLGRVKICTQTGMPGYEPC